jgi:hypothetical protein
MCLRSYEIVALLSWDPGDFSTVGQPRRGKLPQPASRDASGQRSDPFEGEIPPQFTAGLIMEASGNRLPYLTRGK